MFLAERGYNWLPFCRSSNSRLIPEAARIEQWLGLQRMARVSPMVAFVAQKNP